MQHLACIDIDGRHPWAGDLSPLVDRDLGTHGLIQACRTVRATPPAQNGLGGPAVDVSERR
jgi:hypothetical protein